MTSHGRPAPVKLDYISLDNVSCICNIYNSTVLLLFFILLIDFFVVISYKNKRLRIWYCWMLYFFFSTHYISINTLYTTRIRSHLLLPSIHNIAWTITSFSYCNTLSLNQGIRQFTSRNTEAGMTPFIILIRPIEADLDFSWQVFYR